MRQTTKTGSKSKDSVWAKTRMHFGIQLQQQLRQDVPGEAMVGIRVVKLFEDNVAYTGWVKSCWTDEDNELQYHVKYTDGDEEDLNLAELPTGA